MKKRAGVKAFALVLLLLLIGAIVLSSQVVHEYHEQQARARTSVGKRSQTELVAPPVTLESPYAILVLDVSGSMRQSDPQHMQPAAVHEFFHIYRQLSREVVGAGPSAKIAVILFSTVAQVIDWGGGDGGTWLSVTDGNESRFNQVIDGYLGQAASDPRTGGNTDYLAALLEVQRLTEPLPSAPAVVFMTDGQYDPNPLFTPDYDLDQRRLHAPALFDRYHDLIAQTLQGRLRQLSVTTSQLPSIFSGPPGSTAAHFTAEELTARSEKVAQIRSALLDRRYSGKGMEWSVVFLHAASTQQEADNARALLVGNPGANDASVMFADCVRPGDMVGAYIQTVSRWFGLQERPLREGVASLQVPPETEALAIHVTTDPAATGAQLICHSGVTPLDGRDGEWAGVMAKPGECRIAVDGGALRSGRIYFKPRFDWVLRRPASVEVGTQAVDVPIELQLYSIKEHRAVDAGSRFPRLPEELPLALRYPSGRSEQRLVLRRVHDSGTGDPVEYRALIPANELPIERITVNVDLGSMKEYGVMTGLDSLTGSIDIAASVAPVFTDASNQPTAIHVSGLPVHGQKIARWIRRLRGE